MSQSKPKTTPVRGIAQDGFQPTLKKGYQPSGTKVGGGYQPATGKMPPPPPPQNKNSK